MSEACEITGLSAENIENFSYLHDSITKNIEITAPGSDVLKGFIRPLESIVKSNKIHNSDVNADRFVEAFEKEHLFKI